MEENHFDRVTTEMDVVEDGHESSDDSSELFKAPEGYQMPEYNSLTDN